MLCSLLSLRLQLLAGSRIRCATPFRLTVVGSMVGRGFRAPRARAQACGLLFGRAWRLRVHRSDAADELVVRERRDGSVPAPWRVCCFPWRVWRFPWRVWRLLDSWAVGSGAMGSGAVSLLMKLKIRVQCGVGAMERRRRCVRPSLLLRLESIRQQVPPRSHAVIRHAVAQRYAIQERGKTSAFADGQWRQVAMSVLEDRVGRSALRHAAAAETLRPRKKSSRALAKTWLILAAVTGINPGMPAHKTHRGHFHVPWP